MKLIIYTDGASRGNPGPASYGFTIQDEKGRFLHERGEYIGTTTNNVAEYTAVLEALKLIKEAEVRGVVVNQREIRTKLNITKPTLKRRIDNLISLNYISFEKDGNNKYLKITPLGSSILK